MEDELLSVGDVARLYGVSTATIRSWLRKGVISYVMVGPARLKRVPRSTLNRRHLDGILPVMNKDDEELSELPI